MKDNKAKVIIQIDCDSEIAISNHYNVSMYDNFNSSNYYNALNIYLDLLRKYNLKATLFVVGADVKDDRKCDILMKAIDNGHEIANHTYNHPKVLMKKSFEGIREEIKLTDEIIKRKLKVTPLGFRAPNFEADLRIIRILSQMGYRYDCSILSTPYLPLIRFVKKKDPMGPGYLGKWEYMFAPKEPYYPSNNKIWMKNKIYNSNSVIEIPVSTFPYFRFPCHSSYLLALPEDTRNKLLQYLVEWYFKKGKTLVYVFHLADLVHKDYLYGTEKKFYDSLDKRLIFVEKILEMVSNLYHSVTTLEYIINYPA